MTLAYPKPVKAPKAPPKPLRRSRLKRVPVALKRGKGIRQRSNSETAKLRRECERLCSRITLASHPSCECGCGRKSTDAAHILNKKAWPRVRYYLRNLLGLAHECHEEIGDAGVDLTKPSLMRDLVLSMPGGRRRWEAILFVTAGPKLNVRDVLPALRKTADELGIK